MQHNFVWNLGAEGSHPWCFIYLKLERDLQCKINKLMCELIFLGMQLLLKDKISFLLPLKFHFIIPCYRAGRMKTNKIMKLLG